MNYDVYIFDITRADRARDLHEISQDIAEDGSLTPEEKAALDAEIKSKFCRLNRAVAGATKPRWD